MLLLVTKYHHQQEEILEKIIRKQIKEQLKVNLAALTLLSGDVCVSYIQYY